MRRSMVPSIKRLKSVSADNDENRPPTDSADCSMVSCSQGVRLGGFLGVRPSSVLGPVGSGQCASQHSSAQLPGQQAAAVAGQQRPVQQFKCPLPYSQSTAARGSLGAKKSYSGGVDLLAAIQRRVGLADVQQKPADFSSTVSELVLYDPEEHRLFLAEQEAAAQQDNTPPESSSADPSPQLEPPATQAAGQLPPTAPSAPTTAASTANIALEKHVKVHADPFLVAKLRPHQREGVKFVFECLSGVRQDGISGAVLADGMGLGKTFQTIASLYCLLTKGVCGQPTCRKPLILCPTSLVQNWGKEFVKWLGDRVEPVVVDDTKADKVKKSLQDFRGYSRTGKPKVLVMSYPCFRGHKAEVYKLGIDVLMCDEAHFLKNGEAQITQAVSGLPTQRRLLMSGTPIQNDLSEFHAVFDLACPGLLGTLNTFRKMYEGPIQRGRDADATEKQVELGMQRMDELMKLCNKFMLRRTSTVLKELLPTKVEQVVFCKLTKLQLKLYEHFLQSKPVKALLASTMGEDGAGPPRKRKSSKTAAAATATQAGAAAAAGAEQEQGDAGDEPQELLAPLAAITALKKLCCHPDLIWDMLHKHKAAELKAQQMEQLTQMRAAQKRVSARASTQVPKNYSLLLNGLGGDGDEEPESKGDSNSKKRSSRKAASGSARQQLTGFEGCTHLFSDADVYPAYQHGRCQAFHSGKVMVLEALLKSIRASEPTDKVVLVSNYTEALDVLGVMCASHNWVALRLDGSCSVKQRQALVDTFNDPQHPGFVLLLSSKAGGVGLNIIGANRLVLFDPDWNPANDLQAMARVWREGQAKRVWIYRMLMAGSIEEKVLQRQLAKQGLSEALVDEVGQEVRTFSRNELRSLFKVNPNIPCETHCAIKCTCDGSLEAAACSRQRAAAAAGSGSGSGGDDAAEQQGILAWAHLARALDSPDPTWGTMSSWVRDNFVTYVFSDHVLGEQSPGEGAGGGGVAAAAAAAAGGKAAKKRSASHSEDCGSSSGSGSDTEASCGEDEEEAQPAAAKPSAGNGNSRGSAAQPQAAPPRSSNVTAATGAVSAAADIPAAPPATGAVPPPAQAAAAASSARNAKEQQPALPPKARPSAAAATTKRSSKASQPAAARRKSASAAVSSNKAAAAAASGGGAAKAAAGAASRWRNSAPAAAASSNGGRGSAAVAGRAAAAAAPNLSAFAFNGQPVGQPADPGQQGAAGAGEGGTDGFPALPDDLVLELCPQPSDPLDDTPMLEDDADDFM